VQYIEETVDSIMQYLSNFLMPVLKGMNERLLKIGRCCGMEINVEATRLRESQGNHPQYSL
jgi:hypothetical protein